MEALRKFIVKCFGTALLITLSILVMMKGWGLEPQSWWWIIGVGFFGNAMALAIYSIGDDKSD